MYYFLYLVYFIYCLEGLTFSCFQQFMKTMDQYFPPKTGVTQRMDNLRALLQVSVPLLQIQILPTFFPPSLLPSLLPSLSPFLPSFIPSLPLSLSPFIPSSLPTSLLYSLSPFLSPFLPPSLSQILESDFFQYLTELPMGDALFYSYRWFLVNFKRGINELTFLFISSSLSLVEFDYNDIYLLWETCWSAEWCTSKHFEVFIAMGLLQQYK